MQNIGIISFLRFSPACLLKALNVESETVSERQSKSQTNWRAFLRQKNRAREMITRAKRERAKNRFIVLSARTGNPFPRAYCCEALVRVNREIKIHVFDKRQTSGSS